MSDNNNCLIQTKIKCNDNDTVKAIQNIITFCNILSMLLFKRLYLF